MSTIISCDICVKKAKYLTQTPQSKHHSCEDHLVDTVEAVNAVELYIVKIEKLN
jgi:hypothetical protein|tara:strand:+ start:280 stop:441 length:162 start_codon:yes stop_codon:yes gene_type:complete